MPHPVLEAAARYRAQLLAQERQAATRLVAAYGRAYTGLQRPTQALSDQIASLLLEGATPSEASIRKLAALQSLQAQIVDQVNRYAVYADQQIANEVDRSIELGLRGSRDTALASFTGSGRYAAMRARWDMLPAESVETMLGFTAEGSPLRTRLVNVLGEAVAQRAGDALVQGIATGMGPRQVANVLRREMGAGLTWSLTTARTANLWAYRDAARLNYMRNNDIVTGWKWLSAADGRTCMSCWAQHGSVHAVNESLNGHHNCVVGGTVINSPTILATSKRWFDGNVIDIRTVNGHILTVTENHPILTDKGWVAAHLLQVGDNVISSRDGQGAIAVIDPNDYDRPALIEDVLIAFMTAGGVRSVSVPSSSEDFHGDGRDGNIDIVSADSFLLNEGDSTLRQPFTQDAFVRANMRLKSLAGERTAAAGNGGTGTTTDSRLRFEDAPELLAMRRLFTEELIGFGLPATFDADFAQVTGDDIARDAERLGDGILGFPDYVALRDFLGRQRDLVGGIGGDFRSLDGASGGAVAPQASRLEFIAQSHSGGSELVSSIINACPGNVSQDRILEINVRAFSGHVYNLQTSTGWYIASGIITHNCRCTQVPIVPLAQQLGLSEPPVGKGEEMFAALPEADQRLAMGPAMFEAWKSGEFRFADLSRPYSDPVYGTMLGQATLKDLVGADRAKGFTTFVMGRGAKPETLRVAIPESVRVRPVGTPVSQSLQLPGERTRVGQAAREALSAIDSVHGDGPLPSIPVKSTSSKTYRGAFASQQFTNKPIEIRIATGGEHHAFVFVHETGHFIQHGALKADAALDVSGARAALAEWRNAINLSPTKITLDEMAAGTRKITVQFANGAREVRADYGYVKYLRQDNELWARSYAQYIATRSNNAELLAGLNADRSDPYPVQWGDDEFGPIATAIDKLFTAMGWLQ